MLKEVRPWPTEDVWHTLAHIYIHTVFSRSDILALRFLFFLLLGEAYECMSKLVYEYMSIWVYECMSTWVYEYMSIWVYEYMSIWVWWVYVMSMWVYEYVRYEYMSIWVPDTIFSLIWDWLVLEFHLSEWDSVWVYEYETILCDSFSLSLSACLSVCQSVTHTHSLTRFCAHLFLLFSQCFKSFGIKEYGILAEANTYIHIHTYVQKK